MQYAKVYLGQLLKFPYSLDELRLDNPFTKYEDNVDVAEIFPHTEEATQKGNTLVEVTDSPMPAYDPITHRIEARGPVLSDGVWVRGWEIVAKSEEEIAMFKAQTAQLVKMRIEHLIEHCSLLQSANDPARKNALAAYRQALRDVTIQAGFPWEIEWPESP